MSSDGGGIISLLIRRLWAPISMLTGVEIVIGTTNSGGVRGPVDRQQQVYGAVFEKYYEAKYGTAHVPFFRGTFEQAKQEAKQSNALLLACFTSGVHEAHDLFLRETIGDPVLADFLSDKDIIFWMADVVYSSTPLYHLAMMMDVKVFPAIIFIAAVDHRLVPLRRIDGFCGASFLQTQTAEVLTALSQHREAMMERQQEMSTLQSLRAEQDLAYQRSLEADARKAQERAQVEAEEREMALRERQETERMQAMRKKRISLLEELRTQLGDEYGGTDTIKLSIQLPDGQRHVRRFSPEDPIERLYNWAFTLVGEHNLEVEPDSFVIRTPLPPTAFERLPMRTLSEAGISTQMKLIIELK